MVDGRAGRAPLHTACGDSFFSLAAIFGHNLQDAEAPAIIESLGPAYGAVFRMVRGFGWIPLGEGFGLMVIYSVVPWVGVMSLGYLFGRFFELPFEERRNQLLTWGFVLTLLFLLLRAVNLYGDPAPWEVNTRGGLFTLLSFLNATKYPASLDFILMTLGPALLLLPYLENLKGKLTAVFVTFGRVPLFFYLVHIPFIHVCAMICSKIRYGFIGVESSGAPSLVGWYIQGQQYAPEAYQQDFWLVWAAWVAVTVVLYWPCKWFARIKRDSDRRIFSYL